MPNAVLQRRHYEELARSVREWGKTITSDQYFGDFVNDLSAVLAFSNPEFLSVRFVQACFKDREDV